MKTYWDQVFTFTGKYVKTPDPILKSAVKRLEMSLTDATVHRRKLRYFFRRCAKMDISLQSNFICNLFRTLHNLDTKDSKPQFKKFFIGIFSHPKCRTVTRMHILDTFESLEWDAVKAVKWEGEPVCYSVVPNSYKPFDCVIPDKKVLRKLKVHQNNTFVPEELVVVADEGNLSLGYSTLFYGRISTVGEVVRVFLQTQEDGSGFRLSIKNKKQVAKYPQNMELPSFCK